MKQRNNLVELMRFLFSMLVVGYHVQMSMNNTTAELFENGAVAVEFFFLISGYFLARSVEKIIQKQSVAIGKETYAFMKNKVRGILPTHVTAVVAVLVLTLIWNFGGFFGVLRRGLPSVFLVQMAAFWNESFRDALIVPEWYLSAMLLSMLFLLPILLLFRKKLSGISTTLASLGVFGAVFVVLALLLKGKLTQNYIYDLRAVVELLLGMLACYASGYLKTHEFKKASANTLKVLELLGYLIPVILGTLPLPTSLQPVCMIITVAGVWLGVTITFAGKGNQIKHTKLNACFGYLGSISLAIYLFHPVVLTGIDLICPSLSLSTRAAVVFPLSIALAALFQWADGKRADWLQKKQAA